MTPHARAQQIINERLWPRGAESFPILEADIERAIVAAVAEERARLAAWLERRLSANGLIAGIAVGAGMLEVGSTTTITAPIIGGP